MVILYYLIVRRVLKQQKIMNKYKNNTFNKCEQLLTNEEDSKPNVVFTEQSGVSFVSSLSHDKSSDEKSHISLRRDKQKHTNIEQIKENVDVIENATEYTTKRKKNKRFKIFTGSQNMKFNKSIGIHRTTLKVAVIGVVYVLTYVPWFSINLYLGSEKTHRAQMHNIFKYVLNPGFNLSYLGCAVNPLVYFGDPIFRSQCRAIFRKT